MNDNWEPKPAERQWYRNATTGDAGFLFRRDGQDFIRYDRANEVIERVFKIGEWIPQVESRPFTKVHVAQVCFEADKKLRALDGNPGALRERWELLSDEKRIAWMDDGPMKPLRRELWLKIREALDPYTRLVG